MVYFWFFVRLKKIEKRDLIFYEFIFILFSENKKRISFFLINKYLDNYY